jgi:hypothetical protein
MPGLVYHQNVEMIIANTLAQRCTFMMSNASKTFAAIKDIGMCSGNIDRKIEETLKIG